jgi:DNA primase
MSKTGYIDFAAIKAAVTLKQVLAHYDILDSLKPYGSSLRGCCPIHEGDNPKQFSVTLEKGLWKCFSDCKDGGGMLEFVMKMESCTLVEAAWKVNEWFDVGLDKKPAPRREERAASKEVRKTTSLPSVAKKSVNSAPAETKRQEEESGVNQPNEAYLIPNLDRNHPYLLERGLEPETIEHFGVGYCAKGIMAGRIAIPIHNHEGKIVGNAGRWPGDPPTGKPKYYLPSKFKKTLELYNSHQIINEAEEEPLIIVEGYFDVMKLWQLGLRKTVALMGCSLSKQQMEILNNIYGSERRIILMLDHDEAGITATEKILLRLAEHYFVKKFVWPEGFTQPDELNEDSVQDLLDKCVYY